MSQIIFTFVLIFTISFFSYNVYRLIKKLKIGKPEFRFDSYEKRMANVITIAFGQTKLIRDKIAGVMHIVIFWGFNVLFLAVVESISEGVFPNFSFKFLGGFYPVLISLQEIFAVGVVFSVCVALFRRFIIVPKRLQVHKKEKLEAVFILLIIFFIMISMLFQNASRSNSEIEYAKIVSSNFTFLFQENLEFWFSIFWWIHILFVFGFLNYLPYSKHLHIFSSFFNVYFAKINSRGSLKPLNLEDETAIKFGVSDVEDLTWKQLLDGYTCTECGRCDSVCPANTTGKLLSPKKIITNIRDRLNTKSNGDSTFLLNNYITEEEIWACTTCMACVQECPVQIEHIDAIVDMRRYLVLNESKMPKEATNTFQNLEKNFNPWNFPNDERDKWKDGLNIKTFQENPNAEILFFVGCAGSFDARYKSVTISFAKIMQEANIDFAILGKEEKCNGDVARRLGNEYLAQTSIKKSIETFKKYNVKKIVTTCPHCFNVFKNEYPQFGGNYEVIHHTEFIFKLIESGKIKLSKSLKETVTYHDSCYIGRYNDNYESPRKSLNAIDGINLVEMQRSKDKGFCCGAGGGRMFLEETVGKRINIERVEEALSLSPTTIATACPFCMTMINDGLKSKEVTDKVKVQDISELVSNSLN